MKWHSRHQCPVTTKGAAPGGKPAQRPALLQQGCMSASDSKQNPELSLSSPEKLKQLGAAIQATMVFRVNQTSLLEGTLGNLPARVEHKVGQVVATPRRHSLLADGPRGCPLGCVLSGGCPQQAHAAAAKKDRQAAAARAAAQRPPGPAGERHHMSGRCCHSGRQPSQNLIPTSQRQGGGTACQPPFQWQV